MTDNEIRFLRKNKTGNHVICCIYTQAGVSLNHFQSLFFQVYLV